MRLSDIKGERVFDVIADIIDPISNIAEDAEAAELFKRAALPEGVTRRQFIMQRVRRAIPRLLKGHKADIIAILSAIEGVSPDEYSGTLNLVKLIKDGTELLTDEIFTQLFISAQPTGASSGAAQETTEAQKA